MKAKDSGHTSILVLIVIVCGCFELVKVGNNNLRKIIYTLLVVAHHQSSVLTTECLAFLNFSTYLRSGRISRMHFKKRDVSARRSSNNDEESELSV